MDIRESYRILELEIGASRAAVDAAYIRLIEHWHPDQAAARGPEAVREAQRMVTAINDAYHTLAKIAPNIAPQAAPPPTSAAPAAGSKPKLAPLSTAQQDMSRPPPPRPPADTWAARPAPEASAPPPPTPASPPARSPTPPAPTPPAPPTPPALRKVEGPAASAPPPAPTPSTLPPAPERRAAQSTSSSDLRRKLMAYYDALFPLDSPRRRYGPLIVAAALIIVLLLGKCAFSSSSSKSAAAPDPTKTGRLVVKSNVAGATIEAERIILPGDRVTPNARGTVDQPLTGLPPGKYAVTARAEGWPDARGEVNLSAGQTTETAIKFKSGSLRLDSDPAGATVRLGADVLGRTPLVIPQLPPGECQLSLEYPTWPAVAFKTTITENVEATGTVRLPHGKLTVTTTPPGATVLLGKQALGQTPLTLERFPTGNRKLTVQAKDFPPQEISVTVEDGGEVKISPALGAGFPALDPAALLRYVWVPDNPDRITEPFDGLTGPSKPQNGIVKNLNRKRLYETWLNKRYCFTGIVKAYDKANSQIEFAEQENDLSKCRVLAKLSVEARNSPDLAAQLVKGATFAFYGRLTAVEESRWASKLITFEFSLAEPLR